MEHQQSPPSPMRILEILKDRFGALEAVANSSIKLARYAPETELSMDLLVAQSVLEFGSSLRDALEDTGEWARARGGTGRVKTARQPQEGPAAAVMFAQRPNDKASGAAGLAKLSSERMPCPLSPVSGS